jgi:hypothetical protein
MRRLVLATAAFIALAPLVHAQSATGSMGGSQKATGGSTSAAIGQPDPTNCGTPDEPKPCGPMPRKALNHFPSKRANGAG